ncbi:hypothetical protein F511_32394 [Dorcoceras hygrometricum]|uniref:Uncharacterized protein n=1 Tax=Dorcoceras hygrometricum TaxID=472368 RepID=A0A2Z7C656_9LAMI|nr:hypothetical protein F511_32394 [Dorcoceras hygrometricum]
MAIMGGIKINWSKILLTTLKAMVVLSTKQDQVFEISDRVESVETKKFSGGTEKVGVIKVKRLEEVCTRADTFVQPTVKRKCTTFGKAAVRPTVPIQMTRPPKRKLILLDSDFEDPKPLPNEIKVSAHMYQTGMSRMKAKILAVPDEESLSLEDLTWTCRTRRAFPPSVMSREPLTEDLQVTKLDRLECQLVDPRFLESQFIL